MGYNITIIMSCHIELERVCQAIRIRRAAVTEHALAASVFHMISFVSALVTCETIFVMKFLVQ